jgi:hypothetical protein
LVVEDTGLTSLAALGRVDFHPETTFRFVENPLLPACEVDAFLAELGGRGWVGEAEVRGLDEEAICE